MNSAGGIKITEAELFLVVNKIILLYLKKLYADRLCINLILKLIKQVYSFKSFL